MSTFKFINDTAEPHSATIKVIGVGGGGCNAVQHMLSANIEGVEFVCVNTDAQALNALGMERVLQLGPTVTKGLGAGANPEQGKEAALEDRDRLEDILKGTDMLFLAAGMGGGTGTGASPVIAQIAREMNILTIAVVTKPFGWEGALRAKTAAQGIKELCQFVDSIITIPNDRLKDVFGRIPLHKAFAAANDVLLSSVRGISDLVTCSGVVNVDFADVRTVMSQKGMAMMGIGVGQGEDKARIATNVAISSPLLEDVSLNGAKGILLNVTAGPDLEIDDYEEIGKIVNELCADDAQFIAGTSCNPEMTGKIRVTIIATGLQNPSRGTLKKFDPSKLNTTDDQQLEKPSVIRFREQYQSANMQTSDEKDALSTDDNDFDIPSFLRNKAD